MTVINILDSKIYNKIAAGEVVERPSAVVKELLDNSIDAGADDIKIEIKGGGLKSISIKDNGSGISEQFIETAFLPHATSKIKTEDDLFGIKTLGFRGEALSSIAAVSMTEISSATENDGKGICLKLKNGIVTEKKECACLKGTTITVSNLFFNTPARLKFLKSERSEESDIINITARYILSNPNKRFRLICNDKTIYHSSGLGLKDALSCIYGKDVLDNIIKLDYEREGIILNGYIGKPSYSKPNRTYQTLTLNGRYIINGTIATAINNAYGDFLMKRQYPFYAVSLSMPTDSVDVNVHPNKLDVRFEDNKKIFSAFYNAVYGILHSTMQNRVVSESVNISANNNNSYTNQIINKYNKTDGSAFKDVMECKDIFNEDILKQYINYNNSGAAESLLNIDKEDKDSFKINIDDNGCINKSGNSADNLDNNISISNNNDNILFEIDYQIKCTLFDTYIIVQAKDNILLIDQHAAHERILFDKFIDAYNNNNNAIQYLIVPYLLNVNTYEHIFLYNNIGLLKNIGFVIEIFGDNVFKISAVPMILSDLDLSKFFNDLLKDVNNYKQQNKATDYIKEEIIKKACRAAVKGGDKLEKSEINCLLKQLFNGKILLCPHGRPVVLKYSKNEIEKLFKRTV